MCAHITVSKVCMYIYIAIAILCVYTCIRRHDDWICCEVNGRFRCYTHADLWWAW